MTAVMRDEQKQALAEKIAGVLQGDGSEGNEQLWRAVEDLSRRLEALESSLALPGAGTSSVQPARHHPSLEKYPVLEASEAAEGEVKICTFEPHGKPCDHCSLCNSRGF